MRLLFRILAAAFFLVVGFLICYFHWLLAIIEFILNLFTK